MHLMPVRFVNCQKVNTVIFSHNRITEHQISRCIFPKSKIYNISNLTICVYFYCDEILNQIRSPGIGKNNQRIIFKVESF